MDYALCKAFETLGSLSDVILLYDVCCQYWKNFYKRIEASPSLSVPLGLQVTPGIGLFHVHGHKDECIARYSPNYIPSAGQVDGEILETLWAPLNEISGSTRSMSTSHRREVLDDHMGDSNWKKLVRIGKQTLSSAHMRHTEQLLTVSSIEKKYLKAAEELQQAEDAFQELSDAAEAENIAKWKKLLGLAQKARKDDVTSMDIFNVKTDKAPTRAQLQLKLTQQESKSGLPQGSAAWLARGLSLEEQQCVFLICFGLWN